MPEGTRVSPTGAITSPSQNKALTLKFLKKDKITGL